MRTQKQIRLDNLHVLLSNSSENITEVAKKTKITRSAFSILKSGGTFNSINARKIETAFDKPFGWLDEDHISQTPINYEYSNMMYVFRTIYDLDDMANLFESLNVEGKAVLFDQLYVLFDDPVAKELSPKTLYNLLGVKDDNNPTASQRVRNNR